MRCISILQALSLIVPVLSGAQTAATADWPPASGSRVRILSPVLGDKKQAAIVISATPDTLFFKQADQAVNRSLTTAQITRIEIARGTRTRTRKGVAVGFLVGAAVGGATAAATYKESPGLVIDFGRGGSAAFGAGLGGILGAAIGAIVGMRHTDTWVALDVPRKE